MTTHMKFRLAPGHSLRTPGFLTPALIAVALAALTTCGKDTRAPQPADKTADSTCAPVVMVGGTAQIDSLVAAGRGKWVLLNVWATWCKPCVAEIPDLVGLAATLRDRPFTVVGVSMDFMLSFSEVSARRTVSDFARSYHVPYSNIIYTGSTGEITNHFNLSGAIPSTILFDPQGREAERWVGLLQPQDYTRIRSKVG